MNTGVPGLPEWNEDDVESVVIEHPAATDHTLARRLALQVLYEVDCSHHPLGQVVSARLQDVHLTGKPLRFFRRLVTGVIDNRDYLDGILRNQASEWPLEQIALIDRNILRLALYEFATHPTPDKVVIKEAIELAKVFGAEGSMRFVTGVLGALIDAGRDNLGMLVPPEDVEE